ncbi:MAG: hypothetical protein OFPII_13790 [Osedax symbiont Rs1]|nr:MAG: hypothetical protein OFPII_13790 [Osedax symbiont Rs1]
MTSKMKVSKAKARPKLQNKKPQKSLMPVQHCCKCVAN